MFDESGERMYTTAEAAEILGIRPKTVIKLIGRGFIKPARRSLTINRKGGRD